MEALNEVKDRITKLCGGVKMNLINEISGYSKLVDELIKDRGERMRTCIKCGKDFYGFAELCPKCNLEVIE